MMGYQGRSLLLLRSQYRRRTELLRRTRRGCRADGPIWCLTVRCFNREEARARLPDWAHNQSKCDEFVVKLDKLAQQNIKLMATEFLSKGKELCTHGHYEHRLTLTMLNKFLEGGGTNGDHYTLQYRHALLEL